MELINLTNLPLIFLETDQVSSGVLTLLFLTPFIIVVPYALYLVFRYNYWYNHRPIEKHYKLILERHYAYYRDLPIELKGPFERRVALFVRGKTYYGQHGLEITDEMRVLVAATAVQITFGFKFFQLPRFSKIFIYPKKYFNQHTKKHHKGEVYPMGKLIRLSWDNFLHGLKDPEDGINLGLHEMTHAMSLENRIKSNGAHSYIDPQAHALWRKLAIAEMEKINRKEKSLFRAYAGTNLEEFLACSVEVFFEQTQQFNDYHPALYQATCRLLKQDPLPNKSNREYLI